MNVCMCVVCVGCAQTEGKTSQLTLRACHVLDSEVCLLVNTHGKCIGCAHGEGKTPGLLILKPAVSANHKCVCTEGLVVQV